MILVICFIMQTYVLAASQESDSDVDVFTNVAGNGRRHICLCLMATSYVRPNRRLCFAFLL